MRVTPFRPNAFATAGLGGTPPKTIETVLGLLAGAASMCWENPSGAGEFKSTQASEFVDQALELINGMIAAEVDAVVQRLRLPVQLVPTKEES